MCIKETKSSSDEDEFVIDDKNRGVVLGANLMWGYKPHKRYEWNIMWMIDR
jgi:hypothetical protein